MKKQHKMSYTRFYKIWRNIYSRCTNPNVPAYKNYWARWIKFEWKSFEEYKKDMYSTYRDWLQIDRIDNNWNYSKENCRWVTSKENNRNRRDNIYYKWKLLIEWCEELWINYAVLRTRISRDWWTIKKALFTPLTDIRKKVNQYTLEWEFIKTWECSNKVDKTLWIASWNIRNVCIGKRNKAGGFKWKYFINK